MNWQDELQLPTVSVFYSLLIFTISWYFNELHRAPFNWLDDRYRQCFSSSCFSQKSISANIFLSKWRFSLITSILESREKTRVINFRPISIINKFYIFAKVFEKIISIKLTSIIKNHISIQQLMFMLCYSGQVHGYVIQCIHTEQ